MNERRRLLWTSVALGLLLAGCRLIGAAPLPCQTAADCPRGGACLGGLCAVVEPEPDAGDDDAGPGQDAGPPPRCGDGVIDTGETCDDQNADESDGCTSACAAPRCGDALLSSPEQCDDGNLDENDVCTSACAPPSCGDGVLSSSSEQCDDGNARDDDACLPGCIAARCGDAVVQLGVEGCDDGDGANRDDVVDACRTSCAGAGCGDGVVDSGEQCDPPGGDPAACTRACQAPGYGDGLLSPGEECDDGNNAIGDGCDDGVVELTFACFGEPSVCGLETQVVRVPEQFSTVDDAVAAAPASGFVFVAGPRTEPQGVEVTDSVTIVGDGTTEIAVSSGNALEVLGGDVVVQGMTFTNTGTGTGDLVAADTGSIQLTLRHNVIGPAAGRCVDAGPTTTLTMESNLVWRCDQGGVRAQAADYTIDGNVIVQHGAAGVELALRGAFRHNTVADNDPGRPGIDCDIGATLIVASISWRNGTPFSSQCTPSESIFEGADPAVGGNLAVDPRFRGVDDYHLQLASPAIDQAVTSTSPRDFDGEARPKGGAADIGADEAR